MSSGVVVVLELRTLRNDGTILMQLIIKMLKMCECVRACVRLVI